MLRFDTRDKKPKVWNILIASVVMVAVMFFLLRDPGHVRLPLVSVLFVVYLVVVLVFLIRAFFHQLQYNPYSYNTVYYVGFSLFLITVFATHTNVMVYLLWGSSKYQLSDILYLIVNSAQHYMLVLSPIVFVLSIMMIIANITLIRKEGKRVVNFLGILLAILMLAGEAFLFFFAKDQTNIWINLFAGFYLYYICMVIGGIIADLIAAFYEPEKDKDYIIILGCRIKKDGTPFPLLEARIERALKFYHDQMEQTGKAAVFVASGGQGPDEPCSESEAMAQYLMKKGVPEEHIRMEDQSKSTYENMKFSKEIIFAEKPEAKIAFATTNYHVFRSGLFARRVKMRAQGMGARTKWYFWPNAGVREFVGLLTQHKGKQIIIVLAIIAFYVFFTLMLKNQVPGIDIM